MTAENERDISLSLTISMDRAPKLLALYSVLNAPGGADRQFDEKMIHDHLPQALWLIADILRDSAVAANNPFRDCAWIKGEREFINRFIECRTPPGSASCEEIPDGISKEWIDEMN